MGLVLSLLIGSGLGAALGYFGKCSSGTCPLTATPWRGMAYGAVLGLVFYYALGQNGGRAVAESSANVKLVSQAQFDAELAQAKTPVVVDFFATWCGPCKKLSPMLDELAGPLTNKVKFLKVDVDQSAQLAERFKIQGVPTLVFFRDSKPVETLVGLPAKSSLEAKLQSLHGP